MNYESNAHKTQLAVLRHLLFVPSASFAEIQKATDLTSDHFTFHLKKLLTEGYIEKRDDQYHLSRKGKEYANRLDTDENSIEKQPKVSVAITLERTGKNGESEYLFQQRKKNPYFNFWGRVGGKVRWGESIIEAADRELLEETGLTAKMEFKMLYHKRDFNKSTGELLEDKIFLCVYAKDPEGELMIEFEGGVNRWMSEAEFHRQPKRFSSVDEFTLLMQQGERYKETEFYYDESEY